MAEIVAVPKRLETVRVRITDEEQAKLDLAAKVMGTNKSDVVRKLLIPQLDRIVIAAAKSGGIEPLPARSPVTAHGTLCQRRNRPRSRPRDR